MSLMPKSAPGQPGLWGRIDEAGRLVLAPEIIEHYGLRPGTQVAFAPDARGLRLRRPVTHLAKLYIEPSGRCNLDCRTCIRNTWDEPLELMSETVFERVSEDLSSLPAPPTVFFGGLGEPLTHPSLPDWVARAKAAGSRVELITNGTLLTERMSQRLIEAGLDMLWVSLDGATPESYADVRLGASLPQVLANLKRFHKVRPAGIPRTPAIGLAFVAMKRNLADLSAIMKIGRQIGAARLSVSNVLPYTAEMQGEVLYARVLNGTRGEPSTWVPQVSLPKMDPTRGLGEVLTQGWDQGWEISLAGGSLGALNDYCPFIEEGTLSIGWDGRVSPCLPLLHNHVTFLGERPRASRRHIIGHIAGQKLLDLWLQPDHVAFREKVQAFDFAPCSYCGGCEMAEANEEDCFGSPFPTCGGCLWAQGVIRCP